MLKTILEAAESSLCDEQQATLNELCESFEAAYRLDAKTSPAAFVSDLDDLLKNVVLLNLVLITIDESKFESEQQLLEALHHSPYWNKSLEVLVSGGRSKLPANEINETLPRKIGKFTVLGKLGAGGQAEVFLVFHPGLFKNIALKTLPHNVDPTNKLHTRLVKEAQLLAQLEHSGIVSVYDVQDQHDPPFITLELIEGVTLASLDRPAASEAVKIVLAAARGLHYAHRHGVFHRDIKPGNVMLRSDNRVVLIDFGLATSHLKYDGDSFLEKYVCGTPMFMAPELLAGDVDPANGLKCVDIFGLGGVLLWLLTNQPPIVLAGDETDTVPQKGVVNEKAIESIRNKRLRSICRKALSPDPQNRYSSTDAFINELVWFRNLPGVKIGSAVLVLVTASVVLFTLLVQFFSKSSPESNKSEYVVVQHEPRFDEHQAFEIIDRLKNDRDGTIQGQADAFPFLISQGVDLSGSDFSGISFANVNLSHGILTSSKMRLADFSNCDSENADFSNTDLSFAELADANFTGSLLLQAYAPFVNGADVSFRNAQLKQANFAFSSLRNADFSNADLTHACFAFADLRGANFDGANLANTHFTGALLDGATFLDAQFSNTCLTGASVDQSRLADEQLNGVCRHAIHTIEGERQKLSWDVRVFERWPSQVSNSGYILDSICAIDSTVGHINDQSFPLVPDFEMLPVYFSPEWPGDVVIHLDRSYLRYGQREKMVQERVNNHFALIKAELSPARALVSQRSWREQLVENSKEIRHLEKCYFETDLALLMLLGNELVDSESIDWTELAKTRHSVERHIEDNAQGKFGAYTYWPPVFPSDIPFHDGTKEFTDCYRDWTQLRSQAFSNQKELTIVARPKFKFDFFAEEVSLDGYNCLHTISKSENDRWLTDDLLQMREEWRRDLRRITVEHLKLQAIDDVDALLFVFPSNYEDYHFSMDRPTFRYAHTRFTYDQPKAIRLEVDLKVTDIQLLVGEQETEKIAVVFVQPQQARLLDSGTILWQGELETKIN